MSVGFVMMAHSALDRAAQVAQHLAAQGVPVVVHVDARVGSEAFDAFAADLDGVEGVTLADRQESHWGMWHLVEATLAASRTLLEAYPDLRHVYLISGACLPLTSVARLQAYLDAHPTSDFIESVAINDATWTVDGLEGERLSLYFPFSWKRQRRLFDASVWLQRKLGVRRKTPDGLKPHLGSQWWCLTAKTLRAIAQDPDLPHLTRFFRRSWIPDESFFQTLARRHSSDLVSESLTLARFGFRGAPHLFYDDHIDLLMSSDAFFARKIWSGSNELYDHFLGPAEARLAPEAASRVSVRLAQSVDRRTEGRAGLVSAGRYPCKADNVAPTAGPYTVLHGFRELYPSIEAWMADATGDDVHGRLFAPAGAEFLGRSKHYRGGLSDTAALRDYDRAGFLRNLIWTTRGQRQVFLTSAEDTNVLADILAADPHASIHMITGSWALSPEGSQVDRDQAALWQKLEAAALKIYQDKWSRARVRSWSLADAIYAPEAPLRVLLEDHLGRAAPPVLTMPAVRADDGLAERLSGWRNSGLPIHLAGDVAAVLAARGQPGGQRERLR